LLLLSFLKLFALPPDFCFPIARPAWYRLPRAHDGLCFERTAIGLKTETTATISNQQWRFASLPLGSHKSNIAA
jgi:hypothetical protein